MTEYTFEQLTAELDRRLQRELKKVDSARRRLIVEECAVGLLYELYPDVEAERRVDRDLFKRDRYYAIPDEELNLLPSLVSIALVFFTSGPAEAIPDLFALLIRYRRLRVELNGDEAIVLRSLDCAKKVDAGGLTAAELSKRLSNDKKLAVGEVEQILRGLLEKSEQSGPSERLVECVNDRW